MPTLLHVARIACFRGCPCRCLYFSVAVCEQPKRGEKRRGKRHFYRRAVKSFAIDHPVFADVIMTTTRLPFPTTLLGQTMEPTAAASQFSNTTPLPLLCHTASSQSIWRALSGPFACTMHALCMHMRINVWRNQYMVIDTFFGVQSVQTAGELVVKVGTNV